MNRKYLFSKEAEPSDWSDRHTIQQIFGTKAAYLTTLPRAWTPQFALISVEATRIWLSSGVDKLPAKTMSKIRKLTDINGHLIVRSSVVDESIWEKGTYESIVIQASACGFSDRLYQAIEKVVLSAKNRAIAVIIQRFVEPRFRGEFGNLLRISKTRDHWELNTVDSLGNPKKQRLNVQRDEAADTLSPLAARVGQPAERLFGAIGAWINNDLLAGKSLRINCEWVTDNKNFYLVQLDEETTDPSGVNPFQIRVPRSSPPARENGVYLMAADETAIQKWDKLKVLEELSEPNLPHQPTLFFLPFDELPKANTEELKQLAEEFSKFLGRSGIIVRSSGLAGSKKIPNLPRTECLTPSEAAKWCVDTANNFAYGDRAANEFAFVVHRFIAARASAWVKASPNEAMVEIHATWGLPDALQYCPHDTWEVHLPTETATEYTDYKSEILLAKPDGSWKHSRVKNEFARSNSIGRPTALDLAKRSHQISKNLGHSCHIMWFVGCVDSKGESFNLPWYWTNAHDSDRNTDRSNYRIFQVSDRETLDKFRKWNGSRNRQALEFLPNDLNLMRDSSFIEEVGAAAKDANVPIILAGSTLAHAYYQLCSLDCTVITTGEKVHSRIRKSAHFGKLVRDKIPDRIEARSEASLTQKVPGTIKKGFLISKLLEEALELREADKADDKVSELGDLYEVVRAIAQNEGISINNVKKASVEKRKRAGGFDQGHVLLQTGITDSKFSNPTGEISLSQSLASKVSANEIELPFSFFGFMELDQPRSIFLEDHHTRIEITLKSDRILIRLRENSEQLDLPLDEAIEMEK